MKRRYITILLVILTLPAALAQFQKAEIKIYGLTCSLCSRSVEMAMKKLEFVEEINTDLETTLTSITFKDNTMIYPEELAKAVEKAGFSVGYIVMDYNFNSPAVQCYEGESETLTFTDKISAQAGVHKILMVEKDMMNNKMYKDYKDTLPADCKTSKRNYHVALADELIFN